MGLESALSQTLILGSVFFFLPGGYNAINSMAGGIGNQAVIAHGNTILNVLFAAVSLLAPISVNMLGPRFTLFVGALGYPLYILALLCSGLGNAPDWWILVASAVLGTCAALLWTAQGTLIMAYPTPEKKGSYFSYFWIIFNAGGVCNSFAIFVSNLNSSGDSAVTATTFWIFIAVMLVGVACILLLQPLNKVVRPDGSAIELAPEPAVLPEIVGMLKLFVDPRAVALIPLFLYTNWCYNYQFQVYNDPLFDTPTKGLNNTFYWGAQMLAAWLLGLYHDSDAPARTRAYVSLAGIAAVCLATWLGGVFASSHYGLADCPTLASGAVVCPDQIKFSEFGRYVAPLFLYTMWGACDALVQCWSYWILGQLSDKPEILSRYSGWYKTWNSLGSALGASLVTTVNRNAQLWINIGLFVAGVVPAVYVCSTVAGRKRVSSSAAKPFSEA